MKAFFSFMIRWVIPVLGLIALSLIIWFVGPLLDVLVPEGRRWALIVLVFALWVAYRVFRIIQARRQANREMHVAMANLNWRPWVEEALTARESESYAALRAMPKLGRMPCLANNQVKLLINGKATFDAIFEAVEQAQAAQVEVVSS